MLSLAGSTSRSPFDAQFTGLMKPERLVADSLHSPSCVSTNFHPKQAVFRIGITNPSRDPWLPLLGLEGQLPGEFAAFEEVS